MESATAYEDEIEALHQFFVEWYTGDADENDFAKVEEALAPSFEIVSPDGTVHDVDAITAAIREAFGTHEPGSFDIEIRNVEIVEQFDEVTAVRYEEWQEDAGETTGRLSTALFGPARDSTSEQQQYEWRYLQETWLER